MPEVPATATMVHPPFYEPFACKCSKIRYENEDHARRVLDLGRAHYGPNARVYKCSGFRAWHIASRGYGIHSMRTGGRVLCWLLERDGYVDYVETARTVLDLFVVKYGAPYDVRWLRYLDVTVDELVRLGVARPHPVCGGVLILVNRDAAVRICEVGIRYFRAEKSSSPL